MKFQKIKLDDMERAYAVSSLTIQDKKFVVFAGEAIDAPCFAYNLQDLTQKQIIWDKAGGTMSFVEIPNKHSEFIAVQNFFPGFQSQQAKLVWGKFIDEKWHIEDLSYLPFIHRFDLFEIDGEIYVFACQLCKEKQSREDWSSSGAVYIAKLPQKSSSGLNWQLLKDGLHQNHGFCKGIYKNRETAFVSAKEGVFAFIKPNKSTEDWQIEQLFDKPTGEVAFIDIDNDGELEFATIEPFHGNKIAIYKNINGNLQEVYQYPYEIDFAHALISGTIAKQNCFIVGIRRKNAELALMYYENDKYVTKILDSSFGPSNVYLINEKNRDIICSANHTKNEAAIYICDKE